LREPRVFALKRFRIPPVAIDLWNFVESDASGGGNTVQNRRYENRHLVGVDVGA
jgi:hypothetical protein